MRIIITRFITISINQTHFKRMKKTKVPNTILKSGIKMPKSKNINNCIIILKVFSGTMKSDFKFTIRSILTKYELPFCTNGIHIGNVVRGSYVSECKNI